MDDDNNNGLSEQEEIEQAKKVQQALNSGKNKGESLKEATGKLFGFLIKNKALLSALIIALIVIIVLITIFVVTDGVFSKLADRLQELFGQMQDGTLIQNEVVVKPYTVENVDKEKIGEITINDEAVDLIIGAIEEMGISLDDLKLLGEIDYTNGDFKQKYEEAKRKYIKMFIEAQAIMEVPYSNPKKEKDDSIYGNIKIYRRIFNITEGNVNEDVHYNDGQTGGTYEKVVLLKQIPYEELEQMAEKRTKKGKDYEKELLAAKTEDGKSHTANIIYITDILNYFAVKDDKIYVPIIEKLEATGGATDKSLFKEDLVNGKISLEGFDYKTLASQYVTSMNFFFHLGTYTQTPGFLEAVVELIRRGQFNLSILDSSSLSITVENAQNIPNSADFKQRRISQEITYIKTWYLEKVNSWKYNEEYTKKENKDKDGNVKSTTYSWNVDYQHNPAGDMEQEILGKKGDQGLNDDGEVDEETTFLGLIDKKYHIPNYNKDMIPTDILLTAYQMFFEALQKDPYSQNEEQIMRYALWKYDNNIKGGLTTLNTSNFKSTGFMELKYNMYGNTNEEKVWYALKSAGFSDYVAAGIMGNIQRESGFNPRAENEIGAYGIVQWLDRREALEKYAGSNLNDLATQINFMLCELGKRNEGVTLQWISKVVEGTLCTQDKWETTKDVAFAARAFNDCFERSGDSEDIIQQRIQYAREFYEKYKGKTVPSSGIIIGGGITTEEEAQELTEYYNKMFNTIVHRNQGNRGQQKPYQAGPYLLEYWDTASTGYGAPGTLQPFQCTWWANGRANMYLAEYGTKYSYYKTKVRRWRRVL